MAQSYTRQSTFSDGDTITAALFNNEYNQLLNAFSYSNTSASSTGHRHDGTTGEGGNIHTIGDLDFKNKIVVDSTNNRWGFYVEVSSAAVEQIRIQDGAMIPVTDSDVDLGTSSLYWKDAYIDSVTTTGNIAIGGNLTVTGNATISGNLTFGDADTDSITITADVASHITPDVDNTYDLGSSTKEWRDIYIDGTAYLDAINFNGTAITATAAELNILDGVTATASELNILDGVTSTTAELNILDGVTSTAAELNLVDGSSAGTVVNSKAVIYGSSGEVKGTTFQTATNTSGNLLIANGTGFASTAVGDLSEISTIANDDVLLAVDTSGGGLKKVTRATLTAGILSGSEISNVVEDTTPQLGGDLDVNGNALVSTSNGNIALTPNGTGKVVLDGNVSIETGLIDLKNGGTASQIKFYCESANAHAQTLQSAPHSQGANNTLLLPAHSTSSTLVSDTATQTLTNKTLTAPTMTGIVTISSTDALTIPVGTTAQRPTAATGMIRFNSTDSKFEGYDGSSWGTLGGAEFAYTRTTATATSGQTTFSATYTAGYVDVYLNGVKLVLGTDFTATNGTSVVLTTGATVGDNVEILAYVGFNVANALTAANNLSDVSSAATAITNLGITSTAAELNILDGVTSTTAELNILDGVTSTAAELNILDGVTSTATELNILDGVTSTTAELNILDGVTSTAAELNILDGVTSTAAELNYLDITTLGTSEASKAVTADSGAKVKFIGTTSVAEMIEKVTTQTSTTGTINFDFLTQAVEFYTANQGANRTINFRGDGSTALNAVMAVGESMTAAILMTQGSSAYYLNTYQIDGSSVTPEWSGGSAPSSGNASSIDSYVFTIIKTADATFTVLASQTQFA